MRRRLLSLIGLLGIFLTPAQTFAAIITPEQKSIFDGGIRYFDYANMCTTEASDGGGSRIYVVGDSLTVGMRDSGDLQNKLTTKGWEVKGIQATSGDKVSDALPKVQNDLNGFKSSSTQVDVFVVALGTNKDSGFEQKLISMVSTIKSFNASAKIFWMNAYTKAANYDDINAAIQKQSTALGYSVIDWKTEANTKPAQYPFASDGIHHTAQGYAAKADYLVASSGTPVTNSGGGNTQGTATESLQEFIDTYGQMAFDVGKQYGLPYEAILSQAALESAYGKSRLTTEANNFFGIKAGSSWKGPVWRGSTREETASGGSYQISNAGFRAYSSPLEGFKGYGEFIRSNSRYRAALAHHGDPYKYIEEIKKAGYATDNEYVQSNWSLIGRIEQYIKSKSLFPPSSEVQKDTAPPSATDSGSGTGNTSGCPPAGTTLSTGPIEAGSTKELGQRMAAERGWTGSEFVCLDKLWTRESGWRVDADNPTSTAYGIPQAMLSLHKQNIDANYKGYYEGTIANPRGGKADVQIRWGLDYIQSSRYKTPCGAWSHSEAKGWY